MRLGCDSPVAVGSSVNTCSGRRDSEDLPVRVEDTRNQLIAG